MSALHPSLSDRILAACQAEPHSEDDLALEFPRMSRDAIRVKVAELVRSGKLRAERGVYQLAAGVTVTDGAVVNVVSAPPEPDFGLPELAPDVLQRCKRCGGEKPLSEFGKSAPNGTPRKTCRECHGKAVKAGQERREAEKTGAGGDVGIVAGVDLAAGPDRTAVHVASPGSFQLERVTDVERAVEIHRTTSITVADHAGVLRILTLDDEGVDAVFAALERAIRSRQAERS